MPASRSARAMIFAPRSCPSRPGFAITTRIFRATVGQYRNVRLTVVGCSPAWPNPGGAQSGYLVETDGRRLLLDCGPGVLPRLRRQEPWPRLDAIVITHFHLDHWGDIVPWAFGGLFGAGRELEPPELWLPHGGRETLHGLDPVLYANAILELFEVHEYGEGTPFAAAGFELVAYRMLHYA